MAEISPSADDSLRVSDRLAEAAWSHAETVVELRLADALRFHRDWLNGGLQQATFNQREEINESLIAFSFFGLQSISDLVGEAVRYRRSVNSASWSYEDGSDAVWDEMDAQYDALVYANLGADEDEVELQILRYIASHQAEFARLNELAAHS